MATLDRSRPYGQVHGFVTDGSVYVQDSLRFGADGEEITDAEYLATRKSLAAQEAAAQEAAAQEAAAQEAAKTKGKNKQTVDSPDPLL